MKSLNLKDVDKSDITRKVKRFIINNGNSLPIMIEGGDKVAIIMTLEESGFQFLIRGDNIIVVD